MELVCAKCGYTAESWALGQVPCPQCGGYWQLSYESEPELPPAAPSAGIRIFADGLPPVARDLVSLGEGNTPLVEIDGEPWGLSRARVLIKNETLNPTGSFKDRFAAVNCTVARKLGASGVVCASTGNAAMAAAAYSHANQLECRAVVPETTSITIVNALKAMGAQVSHCDWDQIHVTIRELVDEGWFPATGLTAYPTATPFGAEGYKTIAYELVRDMRDNLPDIVAVPVGGGDLLYGILKGLVELEEKGVIESLPTVMACQSEGAAPLVQAYRRQLHRVEPLAEATSIAASINERLTGDHALDYLRKANGMALAVSDSELRQAAKSLASRGIFAEYASAAALVGVSRAVREGLIPEDVTVVCVATGLLLKWHDALTELAENC